MSAGISAVGWALIAVSSASAIYSAQQNRKSQDLQKQAQADAKRAALKAEGQADEAMNAQNMALPDTNAMMSSAMLSGKAGASGTMLTGAKGVDKSKLELQRNTLLGS